MNILTQSSYETCTLHSVARCSANSLRISEVFLNLYNHNVQTCCNHLFITQYLLNLFLTIPLQLIASSNNCPRVYEKFTAAYVIKRQPFIISTCFTYKFWTLFKLFILDFFPFNIYWTEFKQFLLTWFISVIIVPGSTRNFRWDTSLKGCLSVFYSCLYCKGLNSLSSSVFYWIFITLLPAISSLTDCCQ